LAHPPRLNVQNLPKAAAVLRHGRRRIVHMIAEVETVEGWLADAPSARSHAGTHPGGCRPVGDEPIGWPARHPTNASRSCWSNVSNQTKSSAKGDSHFSRSPVTG